MIGKYTFKQDGEIVGESYNLITNAGKKAIVDYLAGYVGRLAGSLAVGIGSAAASVNDTSLQFEVNRPKVELSSADYANFGVVFKAQLPAELAAVIYEVGAYSGSEALSEFDSRMLLDFDQNLDAWSAGSFTTTNSRLGSALTLSAAASTTTTSNLTGISFDLSGYSAADQFTFVYRANNAFVSAIGIRLKTDASNYFTYNIATPTSGTYALTTFNKSAMVATGTPDWSNITQAEVYVTATAGGTASVDFEGLRIEDRDSYREENVLVSRSVLGTPVTTVTGIPMDIEYSITI